MASKSMPRVYRTTYLKVEDEEALIAMAVEHGTSGANLMRRYVLEGLERDRKTIERKGRSR